MNGKAGVAEAGDGGGALTQPPASSECSNNSHKDPREIHTHSPELKYKVASRKHRILARLLSKFFQRTFFFFFSFSNCQDVRVVRN